MKYLLIIFFLLFTNLNIAQAALVGWWKMDEWSWNGTANEVVDSSGNGNHGTASGAITKPGKDNRAGYFDGSNDYVTLGTLGNALDNVQQFTISAWAKPTLAGDYDIIIDNSRGTNYRVMMGFITSYAYVWVENGSMAYGYKLNIISTNVWYHCTMVFDGTGATDADRLKFYLNGVQQTLIFGANPIPATTPSSGQTFRLGDGDGGTNYFPGLIDDVRIYNEALAATQIQQHYNESIHTRIRNATIR